MVNKSCILPKNIITTLKSKYLLWPYMMLLVIGMMIPSTAQHGIFNLKSIFFIGSVAGTTLYLLIKKKIYLLNINVLTFSGLAICFLLFWFLIGVIDDTISFASSVDQFKMFLITLTVPIITSILIREKEITPQKVIKVVIYSNFTYCCVKLIIITLHIFGVINIWLLFQNTGIRVMNLTIFHVIQRFQSSVDISTPFLFFFLLQSSNLGLRFSSRFKMSYILISFISNFFNFSRFLFFIYALSFFLYLFTEKLSQIVKSLLIGLLMLLIGISVIGIDNFFQAVEVRLFSQSNWHSDQARVKQANALMKEFEKKPFIGKGIGGYVKDHLRDSRLKHSYEVQWVAFLMQFGLFGILFILIALCFIVIPYFHPPISRLNLAFVCLFMGWILSGFTNPFLISLQSGIIYTIFLLVPKANEQYLVQQ